MGLVKRWLRRWLGIPEPAPIVPKKTLGFFSNLDAPVVIPGYTGQATWNEVLRTETAKAVIQTSAPNKFARVTVAADGAVDVAMDDLEGGLIPTKTFGLGGFDILPVAQMQWYAAQSFIGHQLCATLMQNWFINKACTMPARDAVRNGYDVTRADGEAMPSQMADQFRKLDKRFKLKKNCIQAVRMMRCFGIRIVLFEVNSPDPDYYVKPFNPDGVTAGSYKGMSQVDPYWISPELDYTASSDPASQHFYEPTFWRINGQRYHRSHLVILTGPEVPDVLKPTYLYGGLPLTQLIYERVYAASRVSDEAPALAMTKRMTSVEGVDMAAAMANPTKFSERINQFTAMRDNHGLYMLGADEKVTQVDTTLTDFDALLMTQWQLACAIAEVPATKMLGTQPKGFNATGEYEASNYREMLESVQEHDMAPIIERHHLLCVRSFIVPKFKVAPFETSLEWAEVDPETAKEKSDREKTDADRDKALADTGAIDGIDVRDRLRKDKQSSYFGVEEAMPEGPRPAAVVLPDAPKTAPNTPPGQAPTPAPAGGSSGGGFGQ